MTRRPGAFELIRVSRSADSGYSDVGSKGSSSSSWTPASSRKRRQGSADTCSTSPTRRKGKRSAADCSSAGRAKRRKAIAGRLDESLIAKWMPSNRQPSLVHWLSARSNEISSTMDSSTTLYCGEAAGAPLERDGFLFMVRTMRYPLPGQATMDEASSRSRSTCPQDRSFAASIA